MPKPDWCAKPSPCDFDRGSAYCVHRECRHRLIGNYDTRTAYLDLNCPTWRDEIDRQTDDGHRDPKLPK